MKLSVKRILSAVLALCLCVAMLPGVAMQVNAYSAAYALPALTGNQAQDTAAIALSQVGYTYSNGTIYGAWWNGVTNWGVDYTYSAWCAMFACWCTDKAGAGLGKAFDKNAAWVPSLLSWLNNNARTETLFASTPQPGDFIFFSNSKGGSAAHVGIVISYNASSNIVTFVGGNQSSKVSKETVTWSASGKYYSQYVIGYGRPNYANISVNHIVDSSYGTNFTAYPKAKITAENIFNGYHSQIDSTSWIGTSDKCTIHEVYTDGCCKVTYPLDAGGTKTVYSKISLFNIHTHSYTGARYHESQHPHKIWQKCVDYDTCGGWTYTGEYYEKNTCEQCWHADFDIGASSVSVKIGESKTVSATLSGCLPESATLTREFSPDNDIVEVTVKNQQMTFTGLKAGTTNLTMRVYSDSSMSHLIGAISIRVDVAVPTYTVSYNANGGTGAPGSQIKYHNTTLTLSSTKPALTGHNFLGWSTSPTATSATYQPGSSFTSNADTTLYAVWKAVDYRVTYNANGGTGAPKYQAKTYGVNLNLSTDMPTRPGYTFLGWSTNSTATSATYQPGATYTANSSTTLYAVWKKAFYGDVNRDGELNNNDILLMNKIRRGSIEATNWELFAGDLDGDGFITLDDITILNNFILKKITEFPVELMHRQLIFNTYPQTEVCLSTQLKKSDLSILIFYQETSWAHDITDYCNVEFPSTDSTGQKTVCISFNGMEIYYTLDVVAHNYSYIVTQAPGTSATGILTGTCSKCSGTTTVTLPKLSTTDYSYSVKTAATCTEAGVGRYTWSNKPYGRFNFDVSIPATGHSYSNGICTGCSAELITGPVSDSKATFTTTGLSLGEFIGLQSAVLKKNLNGGNFDEAYFIYTHHTFDENGNSIEVTERAAFIDAGTFFVADCKVNAKQMSDVFEITPYYVVDGVTYYGTTTTTSVKAEVMKLIAKTTTDAKTKALCVAMLNYGAEAQKKFAYNLDNLANAELNASQKVLPTFSDLNLKKNNTIPTTPYKPGSSGLSLSEVVYMQFLMPMSKVDANGELQYQILGEDLVKIKVSDLEIYGSYYVISIPIKAKNVRSNIYIGLYNAEGVRDYGYMICSVEAFAKTLQGSANETLVTALMAYGDAAKALFG